MKLVNNNLSPIPFYDNLEMQNHRRDYSFGQIYDLVIKGNMLIPFQAIVDSSVQSIEKVELYYVNGALYADITEHIKENGLSIIQYPYFCVIRYPGNLPLVDIRAEGRYFIVMRTNAGYIYSDIFTVSNKVNSFLQLEYWNNNNFGLKNGIVDFSDAFKFRVYLPTQIGKPEYKFEEEVTERMGYSFVESQVSKKIYEFTFLAPEYLCDALRIVRLCENKTITSGNLIYDMTTFSMGVSWEEQGDLAAVECEFETDTVIANVGGYEPVPLGGDYNIDYNSDFNNE